MEGWRVGVVGGCARLCGGKERGKERFVMGELELL